MEIIAMDPPTLEEFRACDHLGLTLQGCFDTPTRVYR